MLLSALREHNGAASNYQSTITNIHTIHAILSELENLRSTSGSLPYVNVIRAQAQLLKCKIETFQKKVQKYGSKLGSQAPKGFYRGSWQKVRWQFTGHDCDELSRLIDEKIKVIQLCIGSGKGRSSHLCRWRI